MLRKLSFHPVSGTYSNGVNKAIKVEAKSLEEGQSVDMDGDGDIDVVDTRYAFIRARQK